MAGNVWEWTRSPYQPYPPYPYDEADDRSGLDADALRVMRGGAFNGPARRVARPNPARDELTSASAQLPRGADGEVTRAAAVEQRTPPTQHSRQGN